MVRFETGEKERSSATDRSLKTMELRNFLERRTSSPTDPRCDPIPSTSRERACTKKLCWKEESMIYATNAIVLVPFVSPSSQYRYFVSLVFIFSLRFFFCSFFFCIRYIILLCSVHRQVRARSRLLRACSRGPDMASRGRASRFRE